MSEEITAKKSAKPIVWGVVGVVAVALGVAYYYGITTVKHRVNDRINHVVQNLNAYGQKYDKDAFTFDVTKDPEGDSFNHDRYNIKTFFKDIKEDGEILTVIADNTYGLGKVDTDFKIKFAQTDTKELNAFTDLLGKSLDGHGTFNAFTKKSTVDLNLASNKYVEPENGSIIEWKNGHVSIENTNPEYPELSQVKGNFDGLKLDVKDEDDENFLAELSGVKFDLNDTKGDVNVAKFDLKLDDASFSFDNLDLGMRNKLDLSQKKASLEFIQNASKLNLSSKDEDVGTIKIENFKSDFQFNSLDVAGVLEACKLQNTREDWLKISTCLNEKKEKDSAQLTPLLLGAIGDSDGNIDLSSKVNDANVKLNVNYQIPGKVDNAFTLMKIMNIKANASLERKIFDNVKSLKDLESSVLPYVVKKGDVYELVFECAQAQCKLNGQKLF